MEIKGIELVEVSSETLKTLEFGARLHQRYSRISFEITEYNKPLKKLVIRVRQGKSPHNKKCTKEKLIEIVTEFLKPLRDEISGITLRIHVENLEDKK
jgi:5-carboxymethyl-2-hydroxymuconate isomerase